jgi:hypothetical protein
LKFALAVATVALATGTARGDDAKPVLWHEAAGGVLPAAGSVDPAMPCQTMIVSLVKGSAANLKGAPAPCKPVSLYIGYLRDNLFSEGLDTKGARLFVISGPNPGHADVEGPAGTHASTDTPVPVVSTLIRAPITPALVKLRWYDVDANYQPHLLGESSWVAPTAK